MGMTIDDLEIRKFFKVVGHSIGIEGALFQGVAIPSSTIIF
jgi:hypothetical protein